MDTEAEVNIESKVNEIFATTKVTQKLFNNFDNPIELEVYIFKYLDNIIFSSFYAKIGDSTEAKSKVIKKEKAEEKYTDVISSGNAAIYTTIDPKDENKIIVHIGNIPPKQELVFKTEFIQFTESSQNAYEFELFRNLPILKGSKKGKEYKNKIIKGNVEIKTNSSIIKIEKKILLKYITIKEENHIQNQNIYNLKYEFVDMDPG